MRFRVGSRVLVAGAMVALAFSVGCGDNSNTNDNTGDGRPTPTRTATPARTATPTNTGQGVTPTPTATPAAASTASVVFNLSANTTIISASADVTYSPAKGSFAGASITTGCSINTTGDTFLPNDNDNGTLKLGLNSAAGLTLPAAITCTFDQIAGPITVSDLTITNKTVGVLDAMGIPVAGDPNSLTIQVTVTQNP